MVVIKSILLLSLLSLAQADLGRRPNLNTLQLPGIPKVTVPEGAAPPAKAGVVFPPYDKFYTFQNLIDHKSTPAFSYTTARSLTIHYRP